MDKTVGQLLDFSLGLQYDDLSEASLQAAKARVLNCVGVSLAAFEAPAVQIVRRLAPSVAQGRSARLFGSLARTSPDMAALVNGAMTRFLDMSDTRVMAAVSHPADALPALLAVAEAYGCDGRQLLLATVIAYEVQCRFVDVVPINHAGWDQTPVVAMGTALACGRLMGLERVVLGHALSLAITPSIALNQTRTGRISMWKAMAGPQGARHGVFAACLAAEGMTGPDDIFDGDFGLWQQLFREHFQLPITDQFAGHVFAVQQTMIKSFPIRFNCHVPVFAALQLRERLKGQVIETLRIETFEQAFGRWISLPGIWRPETRETADHSLPFCVAVAMIDGEITPKTFEHERYRDADVLALMDRSEIVLSDEYAALAPQVRCCRVRVTCTNGDVMEVEQRLGPEDDRKGMSRQQLERKVHDLLRDVLDERARQALISLCWRLDELSGVDALLDATRIEKINVSRA